MEETVFSIIGIVVLLGFFAIIVYNAVSAKLTKRKKCEIFVFFKHDSEYTIKGKYGGTVMAHDYYVDCMYPDSDKIYTFSCHGYLYDYLEVNKSYNVVIFGNSIEEVEGSGYI